MSSHRAESAGDMTAIRGKIAARYDPDVEAEVRDWIKALTGEELPRGMRECEKALRNGRTLVALAAKVREGTANLPTERCRKMKLQYNTLAAPFKQMENIQIFLNFCEQYGVKKTSLFQTVDLFEGRNMAQVMSCIQQLGSEAQRHGFTGATCGPKPQTEDRRSFSTEQMRAGHGIIGLQMGTNKLASQKGMSSMGAVRHVADIRADDMNKDGQAQLSLQAGTNRFASQKGMSMGSVRHVADIRADDATTESQSDISLQAGTNKLASQKGMRIGAIRHVSDLPTFDQDKDSSTQLSLQAGTNRFATQKGMRIGSVRHAADIKADDQLQDGQGILGAQAGSNLYASQKGMRGPGAVRHGADIKTETGDQGTIGLQMGTNQYETQQGMTSMGSQRMIFNKEIHGACQASQGLISLQYGLEIEHGGSQAGMSMGGRRNITMAE